MTSSDLIPKNFSFSASSLSPGGALTVHWTMLNQGQGTATASRTQVRIISSAPPATGNGSDLADVFVSTPQLGSQASDAESATLTVPSNSGPYYVVVVADDSVP